MDVKSDSSLQDGSESYLMTGQAGTLNSVDPYTGKIKNSQMEAT